GLIQQYAMDLSGLTRRLYSPLVPLLALGGAILALRRQQGLRSLGRGGPSPLRFLAYPAFLYLFYSFFYCAGQRFFLPVLVPFAVFAGGCADWLCRRPRPLAAILAVLSLVLVLVLTSTPGLLQRPALRPQLRYLYTSDYDRLLPDDAVLVSSLDVLY